MLLVYLVLCSVGLYYKFHGKQLPPVANGKDFYQQDKEYKIALNFYNANKYDSAIFYYSKAGAKYFSNHNWEKYIQSIIKVADCYRLAGNFEKAEKIIDSAELQFHKYQKFNNKLLSEIFEIKGLIFIKKGEFLESIEYIEKTIQIRNKLYGENDTTLRSLYNDLGVNYFYLGDYTRSLKFYVEALKSAEIYAKKSTSDIAMYHQNIGIVYAIMGDYEKALKELKINLEINRQFLKTDDPAFARIYLNLGKLYYDYTDLKQAMNYQNLAENILRKNFSTNNYELGIVYVNKGNIYNATTDYDKALDYYNKALDVFKSSLPPGHAYFLLVNSNIGQILMQKNNYDEALTYLLKSISANKQSSDDIRIYRNIAKCNQKLNKQDVAESFFILAINKSLELPGGGINIEVAKSYLDYAKYLIDKKKYEKSIDFLNKATNIYILKFGKHNRDVSDCYTRIGIIYHDLKKYGNAIKYFQKAICALATNFNNTNVLSNPNLRDLQPDYYLLNALIYKSNSLLDLYLENSQNIKILNASNSTSDLAINLTEKIRQSYLTEDSKYLINRDQKNTITNGLLTSLLLYDKTHDKKYLQQAFIYSEKSKYAILLSSMKDMEAKQMGGIPPELLRKESKIKHSQAVYEKYLFEENSAENRNKEKIKLWQGKLFELNHQYDSLMSEIEERYPRYYRLKYDTKVASASEIQKKLSFKEAVVSYVLTDSLLFTFAITHNNIIARQIVLPSNFEYLLNGLRESLTNYDALYFSKKDYNYFISCSRTLYKILLEPVSPLIKNKSLKIIPDDKLGYLPFEILLAKDPGKGRMDFKTLPYLLKEHEISYAYSATLEQSELMNQSVKNSQVLSFAPVYNDKNTLKVKQFYHLTPLPSSEDEVSGVKNILGGKIFSGKNATEGNFKQYADDYGILHFAMHTQIEDSNPMYSKLIFYPRQDSAEDGTLQTYELFNMKLRAQLAVLSACNTGSGKLSSGEGIMSMARGFIYAGVPSIVMTLWSVDDKASSDLVVDFYRYLSQGKNKDQALRLAKLNYLKNADPLKSHPYYWAGYVDIGNTKPLVTTPDYMTIIRFWLVLISLTLLLSWGIWIAINRKIKKAA